MNPAVPVTAPVAWTGPAWAGVPGTGVPGSTPTVIVWVAVRSPLLARTVNVSVVDAVAFCRWTAVGV